MDNILSVRQLTERLRHTLEQRFPYVWVKGEVTNLSRPSSGHVYFSLKEGDALLACVWFRGNQQSQEHFDPLTGEVFESGPKKSLAHSLANGKEIVCAGRLSVYAPRGSYQLVVELAQETGVGQWHLAFEALKEKLFRMGWFAPERKRPVPVNPGRVALITAPTGAAVRDFIRIASERGLGSSIRIYPTPVQGDEAPQRIVEALELANAEGWADVAVLIRGGGSIQDLWAFNDERVAGAIYHSRLPVLTGVGHEIDRSIADFVADASAATPSHAAQILWTERDTYIQQVDDMESALARAMKQYLERHTADLARLEGNMRLLSPFQRLANQEERLKTAHERLLPALNNIFLRQNSRLAVAERALSFYGDAVLQNKTRQWENTFTRLLPLGENLLQNREFQAQKLALQLEARNPAAPLERGYALIRDGKGHIISGTRGISPGDMVAVEMKDGSLDAKVYKVNSSSTQE